jgi:hypothetical protein
MKGIIFAGCSFTWGQGLYYYSDLPNINKLSDNEFHQNKITDSQIKFKNTLYFPRLVANHFNTFEIVKRYNGGSDFDSMEFVEDFFDGKMGFFGKFIYEDFSYIIFQTSQIVRNKFSFTFEDVNYEINFNKNQLILNENEKIFMKWLSQNNLTYNSWYHTYREQIFQKIKNFLKKYEDFGIKTKIICWQDDILEFILNDVEMSKKLVILEYENKEYKCIDYLQKLNDGMMIFNDTENLNDPPMDTHPSKKCHQIIADSIIKSIEKDRL